MDVSRETLKLVYGDEKVENEFEKIIEELIHYPENYRQKVLEVYAKQKNEDKDICELADLDSPVGGYSFFGKYCFFPA